MLILIVLSKRKFYIHRFNCGKKVRKIVRNILLLFNAIVVLALITAYLAVHISPADFWLPAIFGLGFPVILVANLIFVLIWALFRKRYFLFSLVVVLFGYGHIKRTFQLFSKKKSVDGVKVVSYNVQSFYSYFRQSDQSEPDIFDYLKNRKADIICLQETKLQRTGPINPWRLKDLLPGINHFQLAHTSRYAGPLTFTKYPIVYMGEIRFKNSNNIVIYTDIRINTDTVRVYNCHLQSYRIQANAYSIIDSISLRNDKQQIREVKSIGSKLHKGFVRRAAQADDVAQHIEQSPYPVIVCGDFNDTPVSYTYQAMKRGLKDAFTESGRGMGNTYTGRLPGLRIDYILHDKTYKAYNFTRDKIKLSDHYPISCVLVKEE